MNPPPLRKVPCPSCRQPALYGAANPWRPWCSEHCRSVDLGAWASERFCVPAQASSDQADEMASDSYQAPDEALRKGH